MSILVSSAEQHQDEAHGMATKNSQQATGVAIASSPQAPKRPAWPHALFDENYGGAAAIAKRANRDHRRHLRTGDNGWRGASTEPAAGLCPSRRSFFR